MKVRQLRQEKKMSLSSVSKQSGISVSYLNEIEKGKKRPKAEKIMALAQVFGVSYDWLVSLKLNKKLAPISELLHSNILNDLPFEVFGIEVGDLLELLSNAPTKLSAFISTLIEINRNYDMTVERFYFSVLRSYQEMHDNYFPEIEQKAKEFFQKFDLKEDKLLDDKILQDLLTQEFNYQINEEELVQDESLSSLRSVLLPGSSPTLLLNPELNSRQRAFIFGKELGFQFMKLKNRPFTSSWVAVDSFDQVLNNFKASYFASAILIPQDSFINDLKHFFEKEHFSEKPLVEMMQKYSATPETFMHRITHISPQYFGLNELFFLRFNYQPEEESFHLTKEIHLSGLHNPHGTALNEHYCRRWVSLTILEELEQEGWNAQQPIFRLQKSKYIDSENEYLVLALAQKRNSLSIGFMLNNNFKKKVKFWNDPAIKTREVNETCERCPAISCKERAAKPFILERQKNNTKIKEAVDRLISQNSVS
nr:helix-turn-helix domain-containing protein [Xanthovirga aplysinae]